ncbi:MAG: hypothetical protein KC517_10250 [Bacteroidetes bacterium]|nr:hypothetical protein [Bacteroidota bacterium]
MKKILFSSFLLLSFICQAQEPDFVLHINKSNPCNLDSVFDHTFHRFVFTTDTAVYQDSNAIPTDPIPYKAHNKADYDTRLIYFVHGLGGNDKSWDAVDDAHMDEYVYTPLRVDYETHQRDFKEASFEVYNEMNKLRLSALYNNNKTLTTDKPYAIGHSQGGLVLRDMDRKYETNYDAHFNKGNRQFHGLITFCTPHLGDRIAISQAELSKLSADFSYIIGNAALKKQVAKFSVKAPFFSKQLQKLSTSGSLLLESLSTNLIVDGISTMSKGQQAPMTQQYGPQAHYVTQTMNYSNMDIPKALFYAEESDPILFKIATYMVGPSASDFVHYPRFGANDDQQIEKGVNELRAKLIADIKSHQKEAEKIRKKIDRTNIPIVGLAYLLTKQSKLNQLQIQEEAIVAEVEAVEFI